MAAADDVEVALPPTPELDWIPRITSPVAGLSVPPANDVFGEVEAPPDMPGTSSRMFFSS